MTFGFARMDGSEQASKTSAPTLWAVRGHSDSGRRWSVDTEQMLKSEKQYRYPNRATADLQHGRHACFMQLTDDGKTLNLGIIAQKYICRIRAVPQDLPKISTQ